MSKVTRKIALWGLSLLFVLCVSILGIHTSFSANAEDTPTVVNLTFNALGLNGGENNDNTIVSGRYLTAIRFNQGVLTGSTNADTAVYDYSNVTENAVFTGEGEYGFVPGATKWALGYKTDAVFNFIYLWTANQPVSGDTLLMKAGSYFIMSGTMADGTACNDKYVLAQDINVKFNGTAWEYYVPVVEPEYAIENLTFASLGLNGGENNDGTIVSGRYLTAVRFTTGILSGSTDAETAAYDYSNLIENTTYSGDNEWGFAPAATKWSAGYKNDAVFNFLYFYTANQPTQGDMVTMKAGSYFTMSGTMAEGTACNDKYVLTEDINVQFNGTAWEVYNPNEQPPVEPPVVEPTEPVLVTFTHINSSWNNNSETYGNGMYYTVLHLEGLLTSGYLGQGDDWIEMLANATINGGASYFNFSSASYIVGPNVESDFIVLYSATAPTNGDEFTVTAGATFKVGGDDTNVYKLANDICLKFNGTAWEIFDPNVQPPVVEPTEPVLVTFTNINASWNNNTETYNNGNYYTVLHLDGVLTSGYLGQGDDWSEMLANATINGGESYFNFSSASYIVGPNVESDFIVLYSATAPTNGDEFIVTAGATFKVGGDDTNVYKLASEICLKFNGTAWEIYDPNAQPPVEPPVDPNPPVEPEEPMVVEVTFNALGLNGGENNDGTIVDGKYLTAVRFNQGVLSGSTDGATAVYDFTNLVENTTNNGSFEFGFAPAATKWAAGYKNEAVFNFIYLWTSNQPTKGDALLIKAGAYFMMSGTLEDGSVCNDKYILAEDMNLKFNGDFWVVPLPMAEFIGVNAWNNNIVTPNGSRATILEFNVENLGSVVNGLPNQVAMAGISINGVKLTDVAGASVSYAHGANYLFIDLPLSAIYPTAEYPITILHVEEGTVFENYELPEITLSLIGGTWLVGEYEQMPLEESYVTISDIADTDRVELGAEGQLAAMGGFEGDVSLKFVYRSDEAIVNYAPFGGLTIYLNSTNSWDGWRIFFVGNKVYVYDATMGGIGDAHELIGEADFGIANGFEIQIEISIKQVDGKYSIVIGGSCAKILEINNVTPIGDCIGGGISMYSSVRSCNLKDYKYGDVFDPILTIYSKQEIVLNEGDAVPEIDAKAVDGLLEITPTYVWDDGAITDGKMNVGIWNCVVTATDANGNYVTATVRVTVKGETKYTVTFDGKNETEYAYGEKIEKPADPTKDATAKVQYTFDGWYNGDEKWDFDHDIVTSDVALVAKFIESDVYYKVTVTIAGEETQIIYVTYGAQIDLSIFDKEGFATEVKQGGESISSLIVTEDTAVEISYTDAKANEPTGGCVGGCTGSLAGFGGIGALLTAVGGCMLIRKRRDSDEE